MKIHYMIGDALSPIVKPALICHVCNDIGAARSGFVVPLRKMNPDVLVAYECWYREGTHAINPFELGSVQILYLKDNMWVSNMIAQHDVMPINGVPPVRYDALEECLDKSYEFAEERGFTIAMPRIASVRSGGSWTKVSEIVQDMIDKHKVETYVYTLPNEKGDWPSTPYENDTSKLPTDDDLNALFKG